MRNKGTRRWWVLGAVSFAILAITLDVTVLTLALPTLAVKLSASESQLQWFVSAYTLALVVGMLPSGLIGDKYGRKKLLMIALIIFTIGSLTCAFSPNASIFTLARIILGLAGAAVVVVALSIIPVLFDERERPRAIGIWSAANFIGMPLGPILGGWLLSHFWWGWIFLMNVPVTLLALLAVFIMVPESRAPKSPGVDFGGLILSGAGFFGIMYGIIEAGDNGWGHLVTVLPLMLGLIVLYLFVIWEKWYANHQEWQPLVDLNLFRSPRFTWGIILTGLGVLGLFGAMFTLPQYFQAVMNVSPEGSGIRLLPLIAGLVFGAAPSDRIAAKLGNKLTVALGSLIIVIATVAGSMTTVTSTDLFIAVWSFGIGFGGGMAFSTAASAAMGDISGERSGVASALLQAIIKLGPAFGASILGSVLNSSYQNHIDLTGIPVNLVSTVKSSVFGGIIAAHSLDSSELLFSVRNAFVGGMDEALLITAGISVVCVVLTFIFLPNRLKVKKDD